LTAKNNALLRAFADPDLLRRLLGLPDRLWREALQQAPSQRQLAKAQAALAPLRIANLSARVRQGAVSEFFRPVPGYARLCRTREANLALGTRED